MKTLFAILLLLLSCSCNEEELEWTDCRNCKGTGIVKEGCSVCDNTGDCPYPYCNIGIEICSFCDSGHFPNGEICYACNGNYIKGQCHFCKGTGKCSYCKYVACKDCNGTGERFSNKEESDYD